MSRKYHILLSYGLRILTPCLNCWTFRSEHQATVVLSRTLEWCYWSNNELGHDGDSFPDLFSKDLCNKPSERILFKIFQKFHWQVKEMYSLENNNNNKKDFCTIWNLSKVKSFWYWIISVFGCWRSCSIIWMTNKPEALARASNQNPCYSKHVQLLKCLPS